MFQFEPILIIYNFLQLYKLDLPSTPELQVPCTLLAVTIRCMYFYKDLKTNLCCIEYTLHRLLLYIAFSVGWVRKSLVHFVTLATLVFGKQELKAENEKKDSGNADMRTHFKLYRYVMDHKVRVKEGIRKREWHHVEIHDETTKFYFWIITCPNPLVASSLLFTYPTKAEEILVCEGKRSFYGQNVDISF